MPVEACNAAMQVGLNGLCFTDHIDFDPRDIGVGFFDWESYENLISDTREKHPDFLVLTGFELNWQEKFKKHALEFLKDKKVDFVLGSVHWVSSGFINEDKTYEKRTFDDFIDEWNREALDLLERDICQGFAHLDYFYLQTRQAFPRIKREDIFARVEDVVESLIKHGVSLEVNTSALRKGLHEPFPCHDFLKQYAKKGGTRVHLGSDAHEKNHIGFKFAETSRFLETLFG
jgi:histidinol-phosphatase (PHP family)